MFGFCFQFSSTIPKEEYVYFVNGKCQLPPKLMVRMDNSLSIQLCIHGSFADPGSVAATCSICTYSG